MQDLRDFLSLGAIVSLDAKHVLLGWGKRQWVKKPNSYPSWFFPTFFFEENKSYFEHLFTQKMEISALISLLPLEIQRKEWSEPYWTPFEQAIKGLDKMIKIVPYVQKKAQGNVPVAASLRAALEYLMKHPGTYIYGFWGKEEGMLGVTPEVLGEFREKEFITMAVAGTVPSEQADEMLKDVKLRHEHQIVVEGICQDLASLGKLEIGATLPKSFSRLVHLVTPICLQANLSLNPEAVIRALHPTPALGAFPKNQAMRWLKSYAELIPRERYGAPVGVLKSAVEGVCYVAIRNMQWKNNQMTLTAGCGIVKGSIMEKEKQEILTKFSAIQEILKI